MYNVSSRQPSRFSPEMGESEVPPIAFERVFSPVLASCDDGPGLDLNRSYSSSPVMRDGPMSFACASSSDVDVTCSLLVQADGDNQRIHHVFDQIPSAKYNDAEVHVSSSLRS
jgi:hypothetical protein